jgi:dTDP-glucose 4,6-dehydratase
MATLVEGTKRVLELARNLLFLSSGTVYGKQPESLSHIPESYLGGPDWIDVESVYAEGKRISETMCAVFGREI